MRALVLIASILAVSASTAHGQVTAPLPFFDDFEHPSYVCGGFLSDGDMGWQDTCVATPPVLSAINCTFPDPWNQVADFPPFADSVLEFDPPLTGDISVRFDVNIPGDMEGNLWFYGTQYLDCVTPAANVGFGLVLQVSPGDSGQCMAELFDQGGYDTGSIPFTGAAPQGILFATDTWVPVRVDWHESSGRGEVYVDDRLVGEGELAIDTAFPSTLQNFWFWRGPYPEIYSGLLTGSAYVDNFSVAVAPILPVADLAATATPSSDVVELTWTLPTGSSYDAIDVERDGVAIATDLSGTDTSYTDTAVPVGPHVYVVRVHQAGDDALAAANVCVQGVQPNHTDLVFAPVDGAGIIDSGRELFEALVAEPWITPYLCSELPADLSQFRTIWVCLGVRHQVHLLSEAEETALIDYLANATYDAPRRLYVEGGELGVGWRGRSLVGDDFWAPPPMGPTGALIPLLGIDLLASTRPPGVAAFNCPLESGVEGLGWLQDWTSTALADVNCVAAHTLDTIPADTIGTNAIPILQDPGTPDQYGVYNFEGDTETVATAVLYGALGEGPGCPGCVADRGALLDAILDQFLDHAFKRGDANADQAVDISDAVFMLNALFLPGSERPACDDTMDANDDGQSDISDPVYLLAYLFAGGAEPPAPFTQPGLDPTPDIDELRCAQGPW